MDGYGDWIKVLVSPLVTFIAFYFTYHLNRNQNTLTRRQIEENARLAILPFLNIELESNETSVNRDNLLKNPIYTNTPENIGKLLIKILSITNIGQATAVKITLLDKRNGESWNIGNIGKNESFKTQFNASIPESNNEGEFAVEFEDLCGRKYYQEFKLVSSNYSTMHFNAEIMELTSPLTRDHAE